MDYKEKYEQALAKAKDMLNHKEVRQEDMEYLFPELKESEDERIRKEIIDYTIKGSKSCYDVQQYGKERFEKWIAWLEKQGKHADFRNKIQIGDKVTRNEDGVLVNLSQLNRVAKKDEKQGEQNPADVRTTGYWLVEDTEQKPAWSEEDEKFFKAALWHISNSISNGNSTDIDCDTTDWLKSLKDRVQPKQEWSEEDEEMLNVVIKSCEQYGNEYAYYWLKSLRPQNTWKPSDEQMRQLHKYCPDNMPLTDLYEQLKKLREE